MSAPPRPERSYQYYTQNTKLAAALGALGLPIKTEVRQDLRTGEVVTLFWVADVSVCGRINRPLMMAAWQRGDLASSEPLHPFLQGLRAEHNYELLMDAQKRGRRIRLVGVAGSHATEYRDGEELPGMVFAPYVWQTGDMNLAAAVGTLGIPVIRIERQADGRHLYTLPVQGHVMTQADGSQASYNGAMLMQRARPGTLDLLLESTDPAHPLVRAYNARAVHGQLMRHLGQEGRLIVHRPPGTSRMAITTERPAENVKERLHRYFR